MVVKPFSHLARQSFSKHLTHGYAQSLVAATQSSHAPTFTSPISLGPHSSNRFTRQNSKQGHGPFQHVPSSSAFSTKSGLNTCQTETGEGVLNAYYEAWQNHQQQVDAGESQEWKQFQFPKLLGWKQSTNVASEASTGETVSSKESTGDLPPLERSYSTSAVDDIKKVEDVIEEVRVAEDSQDVLVQTSDDISVTGSISHRESGLTSAPPTSLVNPSDSTSSPFNPLTPVTSSGDVPTGDSVQIERSDAFHAHLDKLYQSESYSQIPAVFESLLVNGIKPNVSAYNALLASAIYSSKAQRFIIPKALDVYADMLRRNVAPDTQFYSALIRLLSGRASEVYHQKQLLEQKRHRFATSASKSLFASHQADFAILSEDDALSNAVRIFRASLLDSEVVLPAEVCGNLITACALNDKIDEMVQTFSHMEHQGTAPSGNIFPPMIQAFARSGDLNSAVECYNEYKSLAIDSDAGKSSIVKRQDNEVYAAVVRAYSSCGKLAGGDRFVNKIMDSYAEVANRDERIMSVQSTLVLDALLQDRLDAKDFVEALKVAETRDMTPEAREQALSRVCAAAADASDAQVAVKAHAHLAAPGADASLALLALHIRLGNEYAALALWDNSKRQILSAPSSIEATTFFVTSLISTGRVEKALVEARDSFRAIRETPISATKSELTDRIDEAIEIIAAHLEPSLRSSPNAGMNLLWAMMENGGLISVSAEKILASLGPEDIVNLDWQNKILALQVEAGLIGERQAKLDVEHPARFSHLLELCMGEGVPLDVRSTRLVDSALAQISHDFPDIVQRWNTYQNPPVTPRTPIRTVPAISTFDLYAANTDHKGSAIITEVLDNRRNNGGMNEALLKFRNIRRAGRHPRFAAYAKLIVAAAREGRHNLTQDIIGMARTDVPYVPGYPSVFQGWVSILDAMVGACLTTGQRTLAEQYHQELLDMSAAPTANTFGLYITTLKESTKTFDEATEAVTIFNRALAEGVAPSSFLYNALIGKLGKARRIDDCLRYFQEMRTAGIRPTSVTYGTIVNALCRVSDERFAEELFDEMESMPNYKPRPAPYNSLMQFFLTTKLDSSKVLAYYERMQSRNIEPTMHTYKLLIDTYATLEPVNLAAAENVLDTIRSTGQKPEALHYASLIHAKGCVLHDMAGAHAVFQQALSSGEFQPSACLYQALFESMVANHAVSQTEPILDSMSANRVGMTPYIANTLIHGWATEGKINKSKAIFDSVGLAKREPSTYEAMTRAFLTAGDKESASAVVIEMLSRGYPNAVSNKVLELVGHGARN